MKKLRVPKGCTPPDQKTIKTLIAEFVHCYTCRIKLGTSDSFYRHKKNDDYVLCEDCIRNLDERKAKKYKLVDPQDEENIRLLEDDPD
jgi:hypothetical protein